MVATLTQFGVARKESDFVIVIQCTLWRVQRKAHVDKCSMKKAPKSCEIAEVATKIGSNGWCTKRWKELVGGVPKALLTSKVDWACQCQQNLMEADENDKFDNNVVMQTYRQTHLDIIVATVG